MENRPEHDELLRDVFAEATSFREVLLQQSLGAVRRRKQRQRISAVAVTICIFVAAIYGIFFGSRPERIAPKQQDTLFVHSAALPPAMLVTSTQSVPEIHSSANEEMLVESVTDGFEVIGDNDLLRLLSGKPVVLVREDTGTQLVFLNPSDQQGFPVQ
jgi:hypothetical protein